MKKTLTLLLLLLLVKTSFAQDEDKGVRIGLTLSPQLSWMTAGDQALSSNGTYLGLCYGLLLDVLIPKNYAFATGLIVSSGGGNTLKLSIVG